ncbi:hypothetical protein H1R20_g11713, partial [Candolleomyces eurysporus]
MAGAFSGHLLDSFNHSIVSSGPMSFNPNMHGTQQSQSFSMFSTQSAMAFQEVSEATAVKIASLQAKLNQKLGPEYISQRPGPGGGPKLTYAEGWKIINLANEVFGFNGWSSSVVNLTTDFIDYSEESRRYNISVTALVRVTLRDGVFHEDVGSGMIENAKSKGQALDKCKKEAVTDGLKRALRNFGNLLGNCLYDKSYTQEVVKMKVAPPKFDQSGLHRRPEFQETKPSNASTSAANQSSSSRPPISNPAAVPVTVKKEPILNQPLMAPPKPHSMPPPPPPRPPLVQAQSSSKAPAAPPAQRRVNFASSSATAIPSTSARDPDDSFHGFSDDDAFLASVDLEDLGPPITDEDGGPQIGEDADMGPPLHGPDTSVESTSADVNSGSKPTSTSSTRPSMARPPAGGRSSRLEAIIAAQLQQQQDEQQENGAQNGSSNSSTGAGPSRFTLPPANQSNSHQHVKSTAGNENRNPTNGQQQHSGGGLNNNRRASTPIGGFHFPPGVPNPLQNASSSGIGMKRPLDAIQGASAPRGSRPGMGLQQAVAGSDNTASGRQVFGRLDNGDSGELKRIRR